MKLSLFVPCYVDHCFPKAAIATLRVLEHLGHTVEYPEGQTCCGQPAFNSGYWDEARAVARTFLRAFRDCETIVAPSASCAVMVKVFYKDLFRGDKDEAEACALGDRVFEFSQLLVNQLGVTDVGATFPGKVSIHDSCHGLRELGIKQELRTLLRSVRELELVELDYSEVCCGFGGTFSVKFPEVSTSMADDKIADLQQTGARYVVSADTSCLMHLQGRMQKRGLEIQTLHIAELLHQGLPAAN
ncbi:MAG: Fe-S oxidoreductase [Armatimonadetes bacterium CG_4_10_14_3_um_filter_66_18]|nr:(Fe-S)-binding protein [Armatimonadota bacterium]OIP12644.1 MAG: Fe-S oxidoreductase [Armatimonadetes bacterium CG2_30_66_41]PIU88985.1 MAG: Fe-S oxidoreductase [Armatimonadetes bacterium CG06_land_8_20_14_3_00_66_21]PIX37834.1 MAG: Fe-S oxidoreductase [Armatimonadetes bacterium CG_4_8_14_3_um_filter_66_20]PIY48907.1 MAG: Fe-S oxidoreductase [Armatimonadetes bacterium CG_4_10_14_3_um_filter_66_18]PIZ33984.1 MAG: Fe-S oxidoreductase [Armatimonadetes bacterium CG_4_10_14_0_8_um_filter_66_14]